MLCVAVVVDISLRVCVVVGDVVGPHEGANILARRSLANQPNTVCSLACVGGARRIFRYARRLNSERRRPQDNK